MSKKRLVVIGNGMAGVRCVEEIIAVSPDTYEIVIYGSEPRPNYNRIMLSKVLQGEHDLQDIIINDWSWYEDHGIRLCAGETVHKIDTPSKTIETLSGMRESYDILILATGSAPFIPPIPGVDKERVMSFRTIDDCTRMSAYSKVHHKAAVIGGGLLGLEAARGLLHLGMEAVVVHNAPYIMNRQLDLQAATMLQHELEAQGMTFLLNKNTQKIVGRSQAQGLQFTDGTKLEAQVVVVAVGIRPNVDVARRSGIRTHRAIVVDDYMRTSVPDVYAVGECAEHRGISYGLVAPLYEQGKVLARFLCGQETAEYRGSIPYSQLKVSGVDVFSAGNISGEEMRTAVQMLDGIRGTYKKVLMKEGHVSGAILFGDTTESASLLGLVQRGAGIEELAPREEETNPAEKAAAALPDQETVCACNNVSKLMIMRAVQDKGLQTAEQVKEHTKASGSCGGCRPMVTALVKHTLHLQKNGGSASEAAAAAKTTEWPVCSCTDLGHASLKEALNRLSDGNSSELAASTDHHHLYAIQEGDGMRRIMQQLDWRTEEGCDICQTALRYYLKITGKWISVQQPDRAGNRNDILPGAVTGIEVYAGDLKFEAMAEDLQFRWVNADMPAPVRVVLSGGANSWVSPIVQDIGLQESPAGWEIYAGGHAAQPVKEGGLLGLGETEKDAVQLISACLEWYRRTAWYDEPIWAWVERLGFISIRENLLDQQFQNELAGRTVSELSFT
ncbi:MAG: NAD(P)/FAD-dependent oxidoreductase [Paenibacillus sp.]|uniref:nitrite reductase large subunit NirB n=1 Tax=Paenibacillus pabuli TaxID=1472 RepID=UPI00345A6E0D|nr:NAD(P)/FAD-dependent oxidoreductase [Paenibacillus sp.]